LAYNANVTVTQVGPSEFVVRIEETDVGPTDEAVIDGVPLVGRVARQQCIRTGGSASTVWPVLGEVSPADTPTRIIVEPEEPLDLVDIQGTATYHDATRSPTGPYGRVFHQSRPDAGADNAITTIYHISTRW
jgi:hypothetical protein